MKYFCLISLFLLFHGLQAQIPNAGFENWQPNQACLKPLVWNTVYSEIDSSGTYCPVQRSDDHYPTDLGQYSVRIANDTAVWHSGTEPAYWLGWGILFSAHTNDKPLFPVQGRPKSFCGYYRFLPENGDTLNFRAFLYSNGTEITKAHFRTDQPAPEWTPFQVFFNDTNYVSVDSGRITLSSANEPKDGSLGPLGNSVVWVDNISFDKLLTDIRKPMKKMDLQTWQNPLNKSIILLRGSTSAGRSGEVMLSDLQGKEILHTKWQSGEEKLEIRLSQVAGKVLILRYLDGLQAETRLITRPE
jgi:hypothetical protein